MKKLAIWQKIENHLEPKNKYSIETKGGGIVTWRNCNAPVPNPRHRQLHIADLNPSVQSQMAPQERQDERRALPPTPTSRFPPSSPPAPRVPPHAGRPLLPVGFSSAFRPFGVCFERAFHSHTQDVRAETARVWCLKAARSPPDQTNI